MNASKERETKLADFELAIKRRIALRTAGRIHALEVEVVADRIEIRGWTRSFHLKQLAIQGALEEVGTSGQAQHFEIDAKIVVVEAQSVGMTT